MSQPEVYQEIQLFLGQYLQPGIGQWTLDRLTLLVSGILKGQHCAPARIATAGVGLTERGAKAESQERRIRRIENDPRISPRTCFWPLVQQILAQSHPPRLFLIVDPTLQLDQTVLVCLSVWYRGRSLPLVWTLWPANRPLRGEGFWQRVERLLKRAKRLLPAGVPVTLLADRAFGTPAFTDRVEERRWDWVVRVQGQTHFRDRQQHEQSVAQGVSRAHPRQKGRGQVFKKAGWREGSLVAYWGRRYQAPLCLLSSHSPRYERVDDYRRRFATEPTYRDLKSYGWHWEQCQVRNLEHMKRLILGMALASWLTLLVGAWQAEELLAQPPSGHRYTRPYAGKKSLFRLGLEEWQQYFQEGLAPWLRAYLPHWDAPNWSTQITAHHAKAFVLT